MIRATLLGFAGAVLGLVGLVGGMLGLSQFDRDPSSSGAYFAMAVLGSPLALIVGYVAGIVLHYLLQRDGR